MAISNYTQQDYLNYIQFSKKKHLLVEGVTDKRIFNLLFDEWEQKQKNNINLVNLEVQIDTAEGLNFIDVPRNCDRVKAICQSIETKPYNYKLVGFIDREFNEFAYSSSFEDNLKGHKVEGRLVWSRGHSIENYFFEYSILREHFRGLALDYFSEALEVFSSQFLESILKIACAVTLASKEIGKIQKIEDRIIQDFFQIINNEFLIKLEFFKENLIKSKNDFTLEEAEEFYREYINFQDKITLFKDPQIIRWLCHGHIGIKLICLSYDLCIDELAKHFEKYARELYNNFQAIITLFKDLQIIRYLCRSCVGIKLICLSYDLCIDKLAKCIDDLENKIYIKTKELIKINGIANIWAVKALDGKCEYPQEIFQLLGIDT